MEHMGFAGEIALDKGTHELDFKNYGIKILVKWRDSEDLKLLTSRSVIMIVVPKSGIVRIYRDNSFLLEIESLLYFMSFLQLFVIVKHRND